MSVKGVPGNHKSFVCTINYSAEIKEQPVGVFPQGSKHKVGAQYLPMEWNPLQMTGGINQCRATHKRPVCSLPRSPCGMKVRPSCLSVGTLTWLRVPKLCVCTCVSWERVTVCGPSCSPADGICWRVHMAN